MPPERSGLRISAPVGATSAMHATIDGAAGEPRVRNCHSMARVAASRAGHGAMAAGGGCVGSRCGVPLPPPRDISCRPRSLWHV